MKNNVNPLYITEGVKKLMRKAQAMEKAGLDTTHIQKKLNHAIRTSDKRYDNGLKSRKAVRDGIREKYENGMGYAMAPIGAALATGAIGRATGSTAAGAVLAGPAGWKIGKGVGSIAGTIIGRRTKAHKAAQQEIDRYRAQRKAELASR